MEILHGKSLTPGTARGCIYIFAENSAEHGEEKGQSAETELALFRHAVGEAEEQIRMLAVQAEATGGREAAQILEMTALIYQDEEFVKAVETQILRSGKTASCAVQNVCKDFASLLEVNASDLYMAARAEDIRSAGRELMEVLSGYMKSADGECQERKDSVRESPGILWGKTISSAEILRWNPKGLAGIVTERGNACSHAAIIAGTLGIPMISGIPVDSSRNGCPAEIRGEEGVLILNPENADQILNSTKIQKEAVVSQPTAFDSISRDINIADEWKGKPAILANISSAADARRALASAAEGVGLFRSEALYLGSDHAPSEAEQYQVYAEIAGLMKNRPVVIRTMDLGADKQPGWLPVRQEENPALGVRGIRLSLRHPELFRTQLCALLRASCEGDIRIMLPMITSSSEILRARKLLADAEEELKQRQMPYRMPPLGIMIETPAAALLSDRLAPKVDFFSIGTNDLMQYTAAKDRQNPDVWEEEAGTDASQQSDEEDAVLELIRMTICHAHDCQIPVGICGEMAGDPRFVEKFLHMGVDSLSMAPYRIAGGRKIRAEYYTKFMEAGGKM